MLLFLQPEEGLMKTKVLLIAALLLAGALSAEEACEGGVCPLPSTGETPVPITTQELAARMEAGTVIVLDVRPGATSGLPGAKRLSGEPTAEQAASVIPSKEALVVTYCGSTSCFLSENMAKHLRKLGYINVREYPQGLAGWKKAGLAVVPLN
jgi:rhodanese-related sulfurtransferase